MILSELLVWGCIILLLTTSFLHSVAGELMLINPLLKHRGNRVLDSGLARMLIRFAWHVTSLTWVLLAMILYSVVFLKSASHDVVLTSVGICFLFIGLFDLVVSRGRHMGWPFLTLIGVTALLAKYFSG